MPAVGVLTLELRLEDCHSLKDKRHYVLGLKDRLRRAHNVSVAEIDYQDQWQHALIAVATVSSSRQRAAQVLLQAENQAAGFLGGALSNTLVEWLA
jgi:hypothetical protein